VRRGERSHGWGGRGAGGEERPAALWLGFLSLAARVLGREGGMKN
jgi:hypothetical protein